MLFSPRFLCCLLLASIFEASPLVCHQGDASAMLQVRTAGAPHAGPGIVPPGCVAPSGKPVVALFMCGFSRLLLNSTMQRLLKPLVAHGLEVHVYMSLVYSAIGTPSATAFNPIHNSGREDPLMENMTLDAFRDYVADQVATTGACPMVVDVPARPSYFTGVPINPGQLTAFPPNSTTIGHNILERWSRLERLWNMSLDVERHLRTRYSLLMWAKDDSIMLTDVEKPREWLAAPGAERTVWASERSPGFHGVRDKMLAFGRQAAITVMTLFSNFMHGGLPGSPTSNTE